MGGGGSGNAIGGTSPNAGGRSGQAGGGHGGNVASGGHGGKVASGGKNRGQAGGGEGGDTTDSALPYPLNPTLPINPDCSCADEASVCNAAGQCVPRCEPGGVCAVWRVDRDVLSTLTSDDVLYFTVAAAHDDLGNPLPGEAGQDSLWKVHYPDGAPTKLAMFEGDQHSLLAHFSGKTWLSIAHSGSTSVTAIGDDGSVVERTLPDAAVDVAVNAAGVFTLALDGSIDRLAIGADGALGTAFENVVPGEGDVANDIDHRVFVSDRLWRQHGSQLCSFDLANLQVAPHCADGEYAWIFGATGSRIVALGELGPYVSALDVDQQTSRLLWQSPTFQQIGGTMAAGFITGWVTEYPDLGASMLVRFPTDGIARSPTPLIDQDVVRAMARVSGDLGVQVRPPAVTADAVYWTQWLYDPRGPGASRYIFRAPLPK